MKELAWRERVILARLIVALADDDAPAVVTAMRAAWFATVASSEGVALAAARVLFDRCDRASTDGLPFPLFLRSLEQRDRFLSMPDQLMLVARVSMLIRGLSMALGAPVRVAPLWRPLAAGVIAEDEARARREDEARARREAADGVTV